MPRFDANVSMMFTEIPLRERFRAARDAGFSAVEILRPYEAPIADLREWLDEAGLQVVLINSPNAPPEAAERGLSVLPGCRSQFIEALDLALDYANGLGCPQLHLLAGAVPDDQDREGCEATFIENLREAAARAKARGVRLLLEALNTRDVPGYLHTTTAQSRRLIEASGSNNVFLQYDLYHMQIMQGDLVEHLRRHLDLVRHIQFSSVPGRHEPQYGEVNLPYVFQQIDALGYDGWLGCEYRPLHGTIEGLGWGRPYGLGPR